MADSPEAAQAAADAAKALGGMMQGESPPFPADSDLPDHSNDIADIFGLGEEAGPVPNSSEGSSDGGASPSGATPAAEGGEGQAQPATPPVPSQPQPGQQGEPSQAPAQPSPAPAAPATAPAPSQGQQPDPTVQALQAQVNALITQNAQLLERLSAPQGAGTQAPQPGPADQSGQPSEADPYMDYRLAIPDDVANAIFDEDQNIAKAGMAHLVNSLGRIVHERVLKSVTDRVLPRTLQEFQGNLTLSQQQQQMREEYFREHPQHNDPGTRLIVAQEAETMWRENPTLPWDSNARAALGARVNARLGVTAAPQTQGQQQQTTTQPAPAPRPAAQMGASTRPATNQQDNEGDFITSVLSAG